MEEENEKNDSHRRQLRFAAEAEMQEDTIEEDDQTQERLVLYLMNIHNHIYHLITADWYKFKGRSKGQ